MDTRYLRFFVQIGKSGSLTRAAKELFISQQGLSAAIIRLEAELNCKLFFRTRKGIALTAEGEFFLPRAERILHIIEECNRHFSVAGNRSPLRLVCAYGVIGALRDNVLGDFQEEGVPLEVSECPDAECEKRLCDGDADVGLMTGPLDAELFETGFLFGHGVVLIMHESHRLAELAEIAAEHLRGESIVSLNRNFRMHRRLVDRCREQGFEPRIVHHAGEIASVHKLVARNRGVGLTVDFLLEDMPAGAVTARPLRPELLWDVHVVMRRGVRTPEPAREFFRYMLARYDAAPSRNNGA